MLPVDETLLFIIFLVKTETKNYVLVRILANGNLFKRQA